MVITQEQRPARRRFRSALSSIAAGALVAATLITVAPAPSASAAEPCGPGGNKVSCENSKPGTDPAVWDINGDGDDTIQGFGTDISVNVGSRIDFKIDTNAAAYTIDIYRTGWYQGLGARLIASVAPSARLPQNQPACITEVETALYDCGNWGVSASWNVPADAVSGVYVALLKRSDTGGKSHIIFIVREDASQSDIVFQTSDTTWQAYNKHGGASLYSGGENGRAYKISYNRPFATRDGTTARDFYFSSEYAMVRFLERNGYDVSYLSDVDTDRRGSQLLNHNVFLSVGHDEYWSGAQRANIEAARDAGVNLQFLSGNEGYWRIRYEQAASADATAYRTLVCYKETKADAKIDPSGEWTGTWRDPRFAPQDAGAGLPENSLTGTAYMVNDVDQRVTVSAEEGKSRLWRNTSVAALAPGTVARLAPHTVGYESNEDVDNGVRPDGLIRLSTTVAPVPQYLTDFGNTVVPGTTTHHVTMYRAGSGALVFSAGSIQWSWGLADGHEGDGAVPDQRMQQAQVNLLADMGAQPATLMTGLVTATASSDSTPPTAAITSPAAGTNVSNGSLVTLTGTASDVGGVVAGVEVSTDGGATWHAATGRTSWSYSYHQRGAGAQTVLVRAIDDSANYPSTPSSLTVNVSGPYSVFGEQLPTVVDSGDGDAMELGLRFTPDVSGFVTGVRFYKSTANTGTHVGSLWDANGNRLASVTFQGESAAGWQAAVFSTSVPVSAGASYVVSYTAPRGHYALGTNYFAAWTPPTPPLTVDSGFGAVAGLYNDAGSFPTETHQSGNYWVDALFQTTAGVPLVATSQWPQSGDQSVPIDTQVSARFTTAVQPGSVGVTLTASTGASVAGATSYNATTRTVTFIPAAPLSERTTYTASLTATGTTGAQLTSGSTWSFTTAGEESVECPCSLFADGTLPDILEIADSNAVTLGVRFTPTVSGAIAGIKYYKGTGNTETHVGSLWTASGTPLASATFVNESASGWQTLFFGQSVPVQAGTEYVAAYRTEVGAYSGTLFDFSGDGFTRGPLRVGTEAGMFTYQAGFPGTSSSTNYFVDVVFVTDANAPLPLSLLSSSPGAGQTDVPTATTVTATLSGSPSETPVVAVSGSAGAVAGNTSWNPNARTVTFTPAAPLGTQSTYTVTVSVGGVVLSGGHWSFTTTAAVPFEGQYSLIGGETPTVIASPDDKPVELGMGFAVSQPGVATGIRFYKGAGNTGVHRGSLWNAAGQRLATVTFGNETASGWQTAVLSSPVPLVPGERYVVSYFAPNGHYSYTSGYFQALRSNGPLTADTSLNGRYRYGSPGGFPDQSWNATNYFVDIVFDTGNGTPVTPPTVLTTNPAANATDVPPAITVSAQLSAHSDSATPTLGLTGPDGPVAGASAYDATTKTVTFTPEAPLAWNASFAAEVTIAGALVENGSWSFTTERGPLPSGNFTLHGDEVPAIGSANDTASVELGMVFSVSQPGAVTAIRFYKGAGNTGTHVGSLWSASGVRLAQVTFTNETATGWQRATLGSPVTLTPGDRYVVSYRAPNGGYANAQDYFDTPRSSGPIVAETLGNGRFLYGSAGGFPTGTWNASSYFVDVVFTTADQVPTDPPVDPPADPVTVTSTSPGAGATGVTPSTPISAVLSAAPAQAPVLSVTGPAGAVAGTATWNATTRTITFTPTAALAFGANYQATVTAAGTALGGGSWSFTTAAEPPVDPPADPVTVTSTNPGANAVDIAPTAAVTATVSAAPADAPALSLTGPAGAVAGTTNWDAATLTLTFTPSQPLAWSTAYQASVTAAGTALGGGTWSFTTAAAPPTVDVYSLFASDAVPQNPEWNDPLAVQFGTRFVTSEAGDVTGIRFYKGEGNTGVHTGSLWNASGERLAQIEFTGETPSGWQVAQLTTPVRLEPGVEYRVTVHSTTGRYAVDLKGLRFPTTSGPLSTPADGGTFVYGTDYPSQVTDHNFWVDLIFTTP